jgi:diacylglycerol kinase family enzyme
VPPPPHASRIYALAALVASLAAAAVAGYLVFHHVIQLLVALVALAAAVLCGWISLINRGTRRVVFLALSLILVAVLIVALGPLTAEVGLVLGLAVLSVAAARAAIGPHRPPPPSHDAQRPTAVRRAAKPMLIVNPDAGGGPAVNARLARRAAQLGIIVLSLGPGESLLEVAQRAVRDGATALGVAGGDGSQAVVADVARGAGIAFVCVPAGTLNHFAQDLGLDRFDAVRALGAFGRAIELRVDLAAVNGRVFVNNASMGVYAMIVQSSDYRAAKLATAAAVLPDAVGGEPFDLPFTGPDGTEYEGADLLLVSNNPYAVRTPAGLAGRPRLDVGELGVLAVRPRSTSGTVSGLVNWSTDGLVVNASGPVALGIDGEAVTLDPPLTFTAMPKSLRIRLPRDTVAPGAVGRAPGIRQTVLALVRLIAGRPAWR